MDTLEIQKRVQKIKLVGKNGDGDFFGNYLKSWVMEFQKEQALNKMVT